MLGVETGVVIEHVALDEDVGEIVVGCRLRKGARRRCGRCQKRSPRYDHGEGRRRWRALDAGTIKVFIEADAPRVTCDEHWGDRCGGAVGTSRRGPHPRLR